MSTIILSVVGIFLAILWIGLLVLCIGNIFLGVSNVYDRKRVMFNLFRSLLAAVGMSILLGVPHGFASLEKNKSQLQQQEQHEK